MPCMSLPPSSAMISAGERKAKSCSMMTASGISASSRAIIGAASSCCSVRECECIQCVPGGQGKFHRVAGPRRQCPATGPGAVLVIGGQHLTVIVQHQIGIGRVQHRPAEPVTGPRNQARRAVRPGDGEHCRGLPLHVKLPGRDGKACPLRPGAPAKMSARPPGPEPHAASGAKRSSRKLLSRGGHADHVSLWPTPAKARRHQSIVNIGAVRVSLASLGG